MVLILSEFGLGLGICCAGHAVDGGVLALKWLPLTLRRSILLLL